MQLETHMTHIPLSPALNDFIERRLHTLLRKFEGWGDGLILRVNVDLVNKKSTGGPKVFQCTAELIRPKNKPFVVHKMDKNVRVAVTKAVQTLEKIAAREAKMREHSRKTLGRSHKPVKTAMWEMSLQHASTEPQ